MQKQFATFFTILLWIQTSLYAFTLELNGSYDSFRGFTDGSWNGNNGALISGNFGTCFNEYLGAQLGGSYGLYNWDGRGNLVFRNPKATEQQAFVTTGLFSSFSHLNLGILYDGQFAKHFGIYDVRTFVDQIRFQGGFPICQEEIGIWGTWHLTTSHKNALGVPISFRAVNQINFFWSHFFNNCAMSSLWVGAPYGDSLRHHNKTAGKFLAGFSLRAPLTNCLSIDAHGTYMKARHASASLQSKNYISNICVGITYIFGNKCSPYGASYMPVANNANFLVDTNVNQ